MILRKFYIAIIFGCALISNINAIFATDHTWKGSSSSAWSNSANWSPASVPGSSDKVIIDASAAGYSGGNAPVLDNSGLQCGDLYFANHGVLTGATSTDITVYGNITDDGTGNINANASTWYFKGDLHCSQFNHGTANVVFNGTNQATYGFSFGNLTIASGSTLAAWNGLYVWGNSVLTINGELIVGAPGDNISGQSIASVYPTMAGSGTLTITATFLGNLDALTNSVYGFSNLNTAVGSLTVRYTGGNGSNAQGISAHTFGGLIIDVSGLGVVTTGTVTVNGSLTLTQGILTTTSTNLLVLNSTTPVTGGSSTSYVEGPIQNTALSGSATSFVFPTGNNGKYGPIGISGIGSSSTFTAQYFSTAHSASTSGISGSAIASSKEYWTLMENSGTSTANVTLNWTDGTFSGINNVSYITMFYDNGGGSWVDLSGSPSGTTSSGSVTASAVSSSNLNTGGSFTFGDNNGINPLPVSLIVFTSLYIDNHVILYWATASEQNNDYFDVERSIDGITWASIGWVDGHGNSSQLINYSIIDNLEDVVPKGAIYYRLKQVDLNEKYTYSMIRSVEVSGMVLNPADISIYPNPASSFINLKWNDNSMQGYGQIKIMDMEGKTVIQKTVNANENTQKTIDIQSLTPGVYQLQLISADHSSLINKRISKY